MPADFQLSGVIETDAGGGLAITMEDICCAYGTNGLNTNGFDCLIFPNIVSDTADIFTAPMVLGLEQCGRSNGLVNGGQLTASGSAMPGTVNSVNRSLCSKLIVNILERNEV